REPQTAVVARDQVVGVARIDPPVMDVSVRAARDAAEALPPVGADDEPAVDFVDSVRTTRIHDEICEVERPPDHVLAAIEHLPRLAAVLGAIQRVLWRHRFDEGVHDVGLGWGDAHRYATPRFRRQAGCTGRCELAPGRTAIAALEQSGATRRRGAIAP